MAFSPTSLGDLTQGSFKLYVDGSDVGLNNSGSEDIKGVSILNDGRLVLSTAGSFQTQQLSGNGSDLFYLRFSSLGTNTNGNLKMFSHSSANGFGNGVIADFSIF